MRIEEEDDVIVDAEDDDDLQVDLGSTEEMSFEALPQGDYNGVIYALDYSRSQSSNKPMWTVQIEVTEGDFIGRRLYTHLSFSEKAMPGTKTNIKTFAPDLAESSFAPKAVAESGDLLGKNVRVRVRIQKYQGENRNRVTRWLPAAKDNEFIDGEE